MSVLVKQESYETGDGGGFSVPEDFYGTGEGLSQSFTAVSSYTATLVKLKLWRFNSPGRIFVDIYATSSSLPTGNSLSSGSINGNDITDDQSGAWYDFALNSPLSITSTVEYAIVLTAPFGNTETPNKVAWRVDFSGNYAGGLFSNLVNSTWQELSGGGQDGMFSVWKEGNFRQVDTPTPTDTDTGISLTPNLQWKIDGASDTEDNDFFFIYLNETGTFTDDDLLRGFRTSLSLQILSGLSTGTTYYWQVQAISENGDLLDGAVWSFTTSAINPPAPSLDGSRNPTGVNNMITMQRLVVAAKDSIFYEDI